MITGRQRIRRRLAGSLLLRIGVTAGLLAAVGTRIDFGTARDRLSTAHWGWFVAAVAALLASLMLGAVRWRIFLAAVGIALPVRGVLRAHFIGMFTTNFLPTQIGGDITRSWLAAEPSQRVQSLVATAFDRITAFACLVAAAWLAIAAEDANVPAISVQALGAATAIVVLVGVAVVVSTRVGRYRPTVETSRLMSAAREAQGAGRSAMSGRVLSRTIALGLPFQGLVMLALWLVAQTIGMHLPFSILASALGPVFILSVLPLSIGGFGVREAGFTAILSRAGATATNAAVLSLLFGLAFVIATLPGAIAFIVTRSRAAPRVSAS